MTDIRLSDNQNGYDVIGEFIGMFWEQNGTQDVIVSIATSHDGILYDKTNEIASFDPEYGIEFLNDWWEGENFIRFFGIIAVDDVIVEESETE